MKKGQLFLSLFIALGLVSGLAWGQEPKKPKLILLIAEQNIESPQTGWWASEIDLSATEAVLAQKIIEAGYEVLEPEQLGETIKKDKAYRTLDLSEKDSVKLANLSKADYVVLGKAVASSGGTVPQSTMRSCFANLSAKLIRVKDSKIIAYLDAAGNSVHTDMITGGREALVSAANNMVPKLIEAISKQQTTQAPGQAGK
ncbi:MAG: hypothetical protein NTY14_05120 [Candidatus Omnitrophica bacterium]|nr:hypothetical protein [Candidatus Omnitrophota bacterium]